jgi:hypothetical protein
MKKVNNITVFEKKDKLRINNIKVICHSVKHPAKYERYAHEIKKKKQ